MTRLLAFSDLHLGAGADYADDRLADHEHVLDQIVELAQARDVSLIVLAGDIFHRPRPAPDVMHVFRRFTHRLANLGVPGVAVHGNLSHDIENGDRPSALELFASPLFHVFRRPDILEIAGVTVCALPSVPVHRLVAAQGGGDRQQVFADAAELLAGIAGELRDQASPGLPAVLVTHFAISGNSLPTGLPTDTLHEPIVDLEALHRGGFAAVVSGHIHVPAVLADARRPVVSLGSPLCLNFGEAHIGHGAWIIETTDAGAEVEFVELESRPFVTIDVDLAASGALEFGDVLIDETDRIASAIIEAAPLGDAVVRIRYRASEEQHRRVDRQALKQLAIDAGAHRVYQITPEIIRASRARAEHVDETLEPLAALDAWIDTNEVAAEIAAPLRDLTRALLAEQVAA